MLQLRKLNQFVILRPLKLRPQICRWQRPKLLILDWRGCDTRALRKKATLDIYFSFFTVLTAMFCHKVLYFWQCISYLTNCLQKKKKELGNKLTKLLSREATSGAPFWSDYQFVKKSEDVLLLSLSHNFFYKILSI